MGSERGVPTSSSYLEDLDLAAGRMNMLHIFSMVVGGEGVHLDAKRNALLPAVLPGGELGADAVDLRRHGEVRPNPDL